jgi:hypothetical protein
MFQRFSELRQGLRFFNDGKKLNPLTFINPFLAERTVYLNTHTATQFISLRFKVTQEFLLFGKVSVETVGFLQEVGEENILT